MKKSKLFFKSAGLCSFPSDLLPPLNIFILSLICKAFKNKLNSRPASALLMYKYVFNVYLAASDLGLPLPYFLFPLLSTPTKKNTVLCSVSGFCFSPVFFKILSACVPLLPHISPLLIFFPYLSKFSSFLPHSIASLLLVFWCFFCSVLSICLSDFFPIEQLNLKDYRDILFSRIFYFIRACYY